MGKDDQIASTLQQVNQIIQDNQFPEVPSLIQGIAQAHPDWIDARLQAEIGLIEKQMDYKIQLHDWEYFRMMKLVYQYCLKVYGTDEVCMSDIGLDNGGLREEMPDKDWDNGGMQEDLPDKDVIWWCWLQGLDQAPELVKACHRSLEKLNRRIVVITEENMMDYVSFPDWILQAKHVGKIDRTHFSDLLRLELLTTRGGTWIDSTVFCSDAEMISKVLRSAPLFCYSFAMRDSVNDWMMFDNWFLHCTKPSRIMNETKNMLYAYWKNEENLKHYFLFHIIFTIACRRNPEECKRIPIFSNEPPHILQLEMMEPFDAQRWEQICSMSGIHKLTYKFDKTVELRGSMLEHVIGKLGS